MKNIIRLSLLFVLGLIFGLNAAGVANAAACIPQDATETTYKTVPNPDYVPAVPPVEEVFHYVTVVDVEGYTTPDMVVTNDDGVPAWTETIPAVYETIHHEAVYENVHHDAVKHLEYKYRNVFNNDLLWLEDPNWYAFGWINTGHTRWVVDHEAWNEKVLVKEAWDETVLKTPEQTIEHPAVPPTTTVIPGTYVPPVTHEEKVVDVEAQPGIPAVGEPTITVVDVPGKDAVVCEPEPTEEPTETPTTEPTQTPTSEPSPTTHPTTTAAPVVAQVADVSVPAKVNAQLAATGSNGAMLIGFALALLSLGISALIMRRHINKNS